MDQSFQNSLPTIDQAGYLNALEEMPAYLVAPGEDLPAHSGYFSCCFCGVGTSGRIALQKNAENEEPELLGGTFIPEKNPKINYPALRQGKFLQVLHDEPIAEPGTRVNGTIIEKEQRFDLQLQAFDLLLKPNGDILAQRFMIHPGTLSPPQKKVIDPVPTEGCAKFKQSLGEQTSLSPSHLRPSVLDITGRRVPLFYEEALERFADLVLEHRPPRARTLIYGSGQLDYFSVFALQEVFRLLGVRNMTSNCEHGYLAGGTYKTLLGGEAYPFMTIQDALTAPHALYILSGWNGEITHPPIFSGLMARTDLDAYFLDVMHSESAYTLTQKLGPERILPLRSGADSHFILSVAQVIFTLYDELLEERFIAKFADIDSFEGFKALALEERFAPEAVAARIAPEFNYRIRIQQAIEDLAAKLARPATVPIHIPSMGLSQTQGVTPHCLWANILAMLGKFGRHPDGQIMGGVLNLPGQINHEAHIHNFCPDYYLGRIPIDDAGAAEVCARMQLPEDSYDKMLRVGPRSALDFSEPDSRKELFIFFGSQFASNMMNRPRWLRKLTAGQTQFVVIDPTPDRFALKHAALILPTPPHVATPKVFQNGEWRFTLSIPRRKAPSQTRSDTTIAYDLMSTISRMLKANKGLWLQHPDLAQLIRSGYMAQRFENEGLPRQEGEVNRAVLWNRIQEYFNGTHGNGKALYCQPVHSDGRPIEWNELLEQGNVLAGGVGEHRQVLDYQSPEAAPFQRSLWQRRSLSLF